MTENTQLVLVKSKKKHFFTEDQKRIMLSREPKDAAKILGLKVSQVYQFRNSYKKKSSRLTNTIEPTIGLSESRKPAIIDISPVPEKKDKSITYSINGTELCFASPVKKIIFDKNRINIEL